MCLNTITKREKILKKKTTVYGTYSPHDLNITQTLGRYINKGLNYVDGDKRQTDLLMLRVNLNDSYIEGFHRFISLTDAKKFGSGYYFPWETVTIIKDYIPKGTKVLVGTQRMGVLLKTPGLPIIYVTPVIEHTNEVVEK